MDPVERYLKVFEDLRRKKRCAFLRQQGKTQDEKNSADWAAYWWVGEAGRSEG